MKYIRTKSEIFKVEKEIQNKNKIFYQVEGLNYITIPESMIIRKADTIEELCDGFYATENSYWEKDYYLFGNKDFEDFKDFTKDFPKGFARGFIATDKGLIYVAKMDNEGKLVLI